MNKLFNLIIATDKKGGIGKHNKIPWHIPADLRNFKQLTLKNTVVMGRNTWESLPNKPLKNRRNIIISRKYNIPRITVYSSMEQLIEERRKCDKGEWFIIGGKDLYEYFLTNNYLLGIIYWTQLHNDYNCDTILNHKIYGIESYSKNAKRINKQLGEIATYHELFTPSSTK